MTWRPKLVALDVDGTIVDETGLVPPPLADKLRAIALQGVPVVLVTGRSWFSAQLVLDQLGLGEQFCVCNNGATIVRYPPLVLLEEARFDPAPLIARIRQYPTAVLAIEDFGRGFRVSAPWPGHGLYELHGQISLESYEELAARPVTRLVLRDVIASPEAFAAMVVALDLGSYSHSVSPGNWLDIGPAAKDEGLAWVVAALGLDPSDVLAIGDSYNDVELLAWAGRGVALGGAPPELLAVADAVTASFADHGTLQELNRWYP